jgi:hypothetical protein
MTRVALVTCQQLPEPDPDQQPLLNAIRAAGMESSMLAWDDPQADPAAFDLCILRSAWNYYEDPEGFVKWVDRAASVSRLVNPVAIIHWNLHKRYLRELENAGVPIIPTHFCDKRQSIDLAATMRHPM